MKRAACIGSSGFIGNNLVRRLQSEGWTVYGMDVKYPEYKKPHFFHPCDASQADFSEFFGFDRIYQLAANMGGAGFVFTGENDVEILTNSSSINLNLLRQAAQHKYQGTIFYSSSVCVYPAECEGKENDAYPANPPSNYGWEKLFSERLYQAYAKKYGLNVKIARFHNTFGPYGTYEGGREKFPAAVCRKVAQAKDEIEIWGDGLQERPFIFIEDLLDGIEALVVSDFSGPVNLGPEETVTINETVDLVCEIAGKNLVKKHIDGPTGEIKRHTSIELAKEKLNWSPWRDFRESLAITYQWIEQQICASQ